MDQLLSEHHNELSEEEPNLVGIGTVPQFAIGQRALLVRTPEGNVLWDCVSLLDDATVRAVRDLGGIAAIACSHPHFYASVATWADTFDAEMLVPEADRHWLLRAPRRLRVFGDDTVVAVPGITVAKIGGHFEGAAVLHWPAGADGEGALLTGDTVTVAYDRRWVSFMWSYPNQIPLDSATIRQIVERVTPFRFSRIYGGWWGRNVLDDGPAAVRRSAERYLEHISGPPPPEPRS